MRAVDADEMVAESGGRACACVSIGGVRGGEVVEAVGVAVVAGKEGFVFGWVVFEEGLGGGVRERKAAVVEALSQQYYVGDCVVDGEDDHCWEHALEHGSEDVEDIACQPDDDEEQGEAIG